jgi:hypothetical protein
MCNRLCSDQFSGARHNDPGDEYCLDLYQPFVLGHDIKDMLAMIHFNVSSPHCALKLTECCAVHGNRMGKTDEQRRYLWFLLRKR